MGMYGNIKMINIKLYRCGNENSISEYPLGLGYLKSNCQANIQIVKVKKELKNCDLIGLSADASGTKEAVNILKFTSIPVVLGGPVVLWEPIKDYHFKHIVYGDGEISLRKIINGYAERLCINPIKNLDILNFPARGKCGNAIPILTSRGCSWNCNFCSSNAFWGKARFHSANYFIDEVLYILKKYPHAKELRIMDDLFIGNAKRFEVIYEKWMKLELNKKLNLKGFIRSNLLTLNNAKMMKSMGFRKIRFGAESGSDRILKLLNKCETVKDHQKAIDIARSINLPISASFMYNVPTETKEDLKITKDFINKNKGKLTIEGYYHYRSFPGCPLYDGSNPLKVDMKVR